VNVRYYVEEFLLLMLYKRGKKTVEFTSLAMENLAFTVNNVLLKIKWSIAVRAVKTIAEKSEIDIFD